MIGAKSCGKTDILETSKRRQIHVPNQHHKPPCYRQLSSSLYCHDTTVSRMNAGFSVSERKLVEGDYVNGEYTYKRIVAPLIHLRVSELRQSGSTFTVPCITLKYPGFHAFA